MKREATEGVRAAAPGRNRWPVVCGTLVLLWCAWWYCRGEGQGLLMVTTGLAAVAVALPRALPGNTRWVVWSWLLLSIVCLAANVSRMVPPDNTVDDGRTLDRIITVAFAVGLTALFFRPSVLGVTLIALGGLPMTMLVIGREPPAAGAATGYEDVILWVFVALVVALDQAQRLTLERLAERPTLVGPELAVRGCVLGLVLVLAFGLREPIGLAASAAQKRLFGLVMDAGHGLKRGDDLSLGQAVPLDFGGRTRAILLVQSEALPGYLRENVYTTYHAGRWLVAKPGGALRPADAVAAGDRRSLYPLVPSVFVGTRSAWQVEVLAPRLLAGFCLPGNAVTLTCEGLPPLMETNGTVAVSEAFPGRYEIEVVSRRLTESAYPQPAGLSDPSYLAVPPALAGAVSNWVAECEGLSGARSIREAITLAERHFAANFSYQLGLQMKAVPDPLVDFMQRRAGACTHFASAAALMFRSLKIPSRLVCGYVCSGWNPWLDRWVVREREGHAWVEAWDASEGRWLLADPTPPDGHPTALDKPGSVRLAFDYLLAGWRRLLAGLTTVNFLATLAEAGETFFLFVWHTVWSPAGAVVLSGFTLIGWLRRRMLRRRLTPEERLRAELAQAMLRVERHAVPARLRRLAPESWEVWLQRVEPELPAALFAELRGLTERYQDVRYRAELDTPAAQRWLDGVRRRW